MSFSSVLAGFPLPLHLKCYLRVCRIEELWSPTISFRFAYGSWDFIDRGQWGPTGYKFGSVDGRSPDRFLHKPIFGIESCVFPGFFFILSLCSPLDTSAGVWVTFSQTVAAAISGIQGSILRDLFLACAVEDTILDFSKRQNKHVLDYEGQASDKCMDVCLM